MSRELLHLPEGVKFHHPDDEDDRLESGIPTKGGGKRNMRQLIQRISSVAGLEPQDEADIARRTNTPIDNEGNEADRPAGLRPEDV